MSQNQETPVCVGSLWRLDLNQTNGIQTLLLDQAETNNTKLFDHPNLNQTKLSGFVN